MNKEAEINKELIKVLKEKILLLEEQKVNSQEIINVQKEQLILSGVVSSLTSKDKLYLNTLLVNKLLEKEDDGTYKAANDIGVMDKINDLMGKVNNS